MTSPQAPTDLDALLAERESTNLEFKEAKGKFEFDEVAKYGSAFANEGGGRLVLGIREKRPRTIVGTRAFVGQELGWLEAGLHEHLGLKIRVEECWRGELRVLVFHVPAAHAGRPVSFRSAFWMRAGDALKPIDNEQLRRLLLDGRDVTAEPIPGSVLSDLDPRAVEDFRKRRAARAVRRRDEILAAPMVELLRDAALLDGGTPTRAAILLLGTADALRRFAPEAEIVGEYRTDESKDRHDDRENFREGYLLVHDRVLEWVRQRNFVTYFRQGLIVEQIRSFNEDVVREALINAFCHRDYLSSGSVVIRQWPTRVEIVSPGGFPEGVTAENILFEQRPRNRALAEALERCGLAERENHGARLMYGMCAREGKGPPDYSSSDDRNVRLRLDGELRHPEFLEFLRRVGDEKLALFSSLDFVLLDRVYRGQPISKPLLDRVDRLVSLGVVETVSRGRGRRFVLSRRFHQFLGEEGRYTRTRGLDKPTNKALLEQHIRENAAHGSPLAKLQQVLPHLSAAQIQSLLRELKAEGKVRVSGRTKAARWYPGATPEDSS